MQASGGIARVARTPSDHPIVAAVAVAAEDPFSLQVAVGGVSQRPLLIRLEGRTGAGETIAQAIEAAEPYADFRGSAEYRRAIGLLTAERALEHTVARA
jgi:CO/xanthine dehydrogenase FAD-binding subunit